MAGSGGPTLVRGVSKAAGGETTPYLLGIACNRYTENPMSVPIVGQHAEVLIWYPTTILKCKCLEVGTVLVLVAIGTPVTCPNCKRGYRVEGFQQNELGLQPIINMQRVF